MEICKVAGNVTSTVKNSNLTGYKLLVVQPLAGPAYVAVDTAGAGIGETVLVVRGSGSREIAGIKEAPVDAAVVAILDEPWPR